MSESTNNVNIYFKKFIEDKSDISFKLFYHSIAKYLITTSFSITRRREESEDIVAEVLMKLWQHSDPSSIKNIKTYLIQAVRNKSLDLVDSIKYKNEVSEKEKNIAFLNRTLLGDQPLHILIHKELEELLNKAIDEMKGDKKEVFEMIRLKGLTYQQAADEKGISLKTVEKYMKQNLAILDKYKLPNSRKNGKSGSGNIQNNTISILIISEILNFFNFFTKKRRVYSS